MQLGTGTKDDQNFGCVHRFSPRYYAKYFSYNPALPATWIGQLVEVKTIKQSDTKNGGYKIYLICTKHGSRKFLD